MYDRNILLIDDTKALCELYTIALEGEGYSVTSAASGAALLEILQTDSFAPNLLILDVKLPDIDGLELLGRLKDMGFDAPVIVITGHGSIHMAVEAMRLGATDFLVKPFPIERLCESAGRALSAAGLATKAGLNANDETLLAQRPQRAQTTATPRKGFGGFIGISPPMQTVYDIIESAAKSNATVFITGESGTGKDLCAEAIHHYSPRSHAPFIAINCASIPRELLESELFGHVKGAFTGALSDRDGAVSMARGGTLFLDEIAEMTPDMQSKLLRFLQNLTFRKVGSNTEQKANVRIVCATNRDPLEEVRAGRFRQDLYYRLHVIPIHMPSLRERRNDIIDLADFFLKTHAREENKSFRSFSAEAEKILTAYDWPGNVRQMQNVVRGIVVLHADTKIVSAAMLPTVLRQPRGMGHVMPPLRQLPTDREALLQEEIDDDVRPLWQVERSAIEKAIALCEGNIPRAAAMLEISPSTIYRKKMIWDKHPGAESNGHYSGF